jgi:3-oxoacyl-[acyl-carrier-protein] synthase II
VDELTDNSFTIMNRLGHWKRKPVNNMDLFQDKTRGSIAGEGAAFFLLSKEKNNNTFAKVIGVDTFYKPRDTSEIQVRIQEFLQKQGIPLAGLDLILLGMNGDPSQDLTYNQLNKDLLKNSRTACFKHLCGEYFTSGAFALWLAAKILKHQRIPAAVTSGTPAASVINNILIYNHYRNIDHSLMLISKA